MGSFFVWILSRAQISSLTSEGFFIEVLSVTILETTKTVPATEEDAQRFYRSQFWRLQKHEHNGQDILFRFIGHNFGDYKTPPDLRRLSQSVLSVIILETTKTDIVTVFDKERFYRSQFLRLQKLEELAENYIARFIGHNFGDYKNLVSSFLNQMEVLSVTILETTKTSNGIS